MVPATSRARPVTLPDDFRPFRPCIVNVDTMLEVAVRTKVQKWGNSLAVRIPRSFADEVGLSDGTAVEMRLSESGLSIEPVPVPQATLEALLEGITPENLHDEIDVGAPVGKETW